MHLGPHVPTRQTGLDRLDHDACGRLSLEDRLDKLLVVLEELPAPLAGARVVVALIEDDGPRGVLEDGLLDPIDRVRHLRAAEAAVDEGQSTKTVSRVPAHGARAADEDRGVGGEAVLGVIRRELFDRIGKTSGIGIGDLPEEKGGRRCDEECYDHAKAGSKGRLHSTLQCPEVSIMGRTIDPAGTPPVASRH